MNSKWRLFVVWLTMSLVVGFLSSFLVPGDSADRGDAESLASLSGGLGQGITLAALGGYRNVTANFVWISMYGDWRYRLKTEVLEKMRLAVSLNPDNVYFWVDGSRIIANDMPVWQVGDDLMETLFGDGPAVEVRKEYAETALAFLDEAPERIAHQIPILLEKGSICWKRLEDLDRALVYFKEAVERPEVPFFVCRVYAELLYRNGEVRAAYEYLKGHYATLSDDEPTALKPLVANRILELERELSQSR